jgi:cytochrome P450
MRDADLTFGAGNRVCIGRYLALMEIYKIVPTLLLRYKVCNSSSLRIDSQD